MKKIYIIAMMIFCTPAIAAQTDLGAALEKNFYGPHYLVGAADAWDSLIGTPWRGGRIASYMNNLHQANEDARMFDVLETLAYNSTTMTILQSRQYLDNAFDAIDAQGATGIRRSARTFGLDAYGIAESADFDGSKNNDYTLHTGGAGVQAYAYVTDGFAFGVGYTYHDSKSHDMPTHVDATSHIISMFSKYESSGGLFINTSLAAGRVQWDLDKRVAGVKNDTSFNTDIWGAKINTGIIARRGTAYIQPEINVQYSRIITEHFVDAAAQDFKKWWYNNLTAGADVRLGMDFSGGGVVFSPNINIGAGYDIIHNGTDNVHVGVISGGHYDMPVVAPNRTGLRGGLGIGMYGAGISGDVRYQLDSRSDYIAHTVAATLKITF